MMRVKVWSLISICSILLISGILQIDRNQVDMNAINKFMELEKAHCYFDWDVKSYSSITEAMYKSRKYLTDYQFDGGAEIGGITTVDEAIDLVDKLSGEVIAGTTPYVRDWILTNAVYDVMGQCESDSEDYYKVVVAMYSKLHRYETSMLTDDFWYFYRYADAITFAVGSLAIISTFMLASSIYHLSQNRKGSIGESDE